MSCGTVVHSELRPSERHMVNTPATIAFLLYCGQRVNKPNVNGAIMYRIPIAEVPMAGIPDEPANSGDEL